CARQGRGAWNDPLYFDSW
nr:immunoglobulin heavy chain junction region [Macaca mulatta]MOX02008.1 immunoglobulin heavy chain junction region [Macaca mulatta]